MLSTHFKFDLYLKSCWADVVADQILGHLENDDTAAVRLYTFETTRLKRR